VGGLLSAEAEFQSQAPGFVPRESLPNDEKCAALFDGFVALGEPAWALAMRLKHRSGVRWGELIALRPRDIDFEPLRVVPVHLAVEQSGEARTIKSTKNSQKRTATFPASLTADPSGHVEAVRRHAGDDALLFALSDGRLAERRQFLRLWLRAAKRAGWNMRSAQSAQWHPHDLRHVAACWMLFDVRIDPAVVSRMLGHANVAFTLSRYVAERTGADAATNALTEEW
jgi:integrase